MIHVSTHIALRKFLDTLSTTRVETVIGIADTFLKRVGYVKPRIAVAGVNPHAGENGLFGDEETRILTPAITDARAKVWTFMGRVRRILYFSRLMRGSMIWWWRCIMTRDISR